MKRGCFYGIGVGPGDPEWMTVKAVRILSRCRQVCVPKLSENAVSLALQIARKYLLSDAEIHELPFPMTNDATVLAEHWRGAARRVLEILEGGEDCCFLTLGDALLYSTYIYLLRELKRLCPAANTVTVPGVTAFSAAAALAGCPIGEGKQPVTVLPTSDDLDRLAEAIDRGGTIVLMKVGRRLDRILEILESHGLSGQAVFVARAGLPGERIETDPCRLKGSDQETGYLSVLLVQADGAGEEEATR